MPLPLELVLAIALHLPANALPALALTCVSWSHIAQRVLYRHLSASPARHLSLVPLLAKKPHIARHVRSFYVALDPAAAVFPRFYAVLADALYNMSELHSLHLLVDPCASWLLRLPATRAVYPSLVHFTSSFPLDANVARFLQLTPCLRQLELDSIPTIVPPNSPLPPLPETLVPRLEQFIGSPRAASLIVPGRPVTSIHLNASVLPEDDIPLLARSTAHVLVLATVTNSPPLSFLQLLQHHFPHLAYLRVMSTQNLLRPPSPEFYEQVAHVLGSFAQLSAFELSGIHWCSQRKPDDDSKRVWQTSPLLCTTHPTDDLLLHPDIFMHTDAM